MATRVSVCMATHNGGGHIKEQIESILSQLTDEDEIIISDDGSTDNTLDIIDSFGDHRIKVHHYRQEQDFSHRKQASFYYATANFFNSLTHANGRYIFLSDQDDRWMKDKVSICLKELKNTDIINHNFSVMDSHGDIIEHKHLKCPVKGGLSFLNAIRLLPFRGCCLAFKREVLESAMPFPRDIFLHDCWIGLRGVYKGFTFRFIDIPLITYRRHESNVSSFTPHNPLWYKAAYRLKLLFQVISRR